MPFFFGAEAHRIIMNSKFTTVCGIKRLLVQLLKHKGFDQTDSLNLQNEIVLQNKESESELSVHQQINAGLNKQNISLNINRE